MPCPLSMGRWCLLFHPGRSTSARGYFARRMAVFVWAARTRKRTRRKGRGRNSDTTHGTLIASACSTTDVAASLIRFSAYAARAKMTLAWQSIGQARALFVLVASVDRRSLASFSYLPPSLADGCRTFATAAENRALVNCGPYSVRKSICPRQ
jgi:hypothetical protein